MVSALEPVVMVPAASPDEEALRDAEEREKWLNAFWEASEREARKSLLTRMAWQGFQRGMVVARVIFRLDRLVHRGTGEEAEERPYAPDEMPSRRVAEYEQGDLLPVQVQVRDPLSVWPEWNEDGLVCVVETLERRVRDVRRRHGDEALPGRGGAEVVEWREYWDDERWIGWADGVLVVDEEHGIGAVPYAIEMPISAESGQPEREVRPFLEQAEGIAARINRILSIQETTAVQYNNDALAVTGDVTHGPGREQGISLRPFEVNYLRPGSTLQWIRRSGGSPPDTTQLLQLYLQEWERATWPAEMHGMERMARSGYAWGLLTESGRIRLVPVIEAIQDVMERADELVMRVLERELGQLVGGWVHLDVVEVADRDGREVRTRRRVTIDTQAIEGDYASQVTLGQPATADKMQRALMGERLAKGGLLSRRTVAEEYLGVSSWAEERERLAREQAEQDPVMVQARAALYRVEALRQLRKDLEDMELDEEEMALVMTQLQQVGMSQKQAPAPPPMGPGMAMGPGGFPAEAGGAYGMPGEEQLAMGPGMGPGLEQEMGWPGMMPGGYR